MSANSIYADVQLRPRPTLIATALPLSAGQESGIRFLLRERDRSSLPACAGFRVRRVFHSTGWPGWLTPNSLCGAGPPISRRVRASAFSVRPYTLYCYVYGKARYAVKPCVPAAARKPVAICHTAASETPAEHSRGTAVLRCPEFVPFCDDFQGVGRPGLKPNS